MKIGELAAAAGLTVETIRYYEAAGLLRAHRRTEGNYRIFGTEEQERLQFIKKAKRLGLSLAEIRDVLVIQERQQPTCQHVRSLLHAKVAEVDQAIEQLEEFRRLLVNLLDQAGTVEDCRPSGGRICGIIEQAPLAVQPALLQRLRASERHPRDG